MGIVGEQCTAVRRYHLQESPVVALPFPCAHVLAPVLTWRCRAGRKVPSEMCFVHLFPGEHTVPDLMVKITTLETHFLSPEDGLPKRTIGLLTESYCSVKWKMLCQHCSLEVSETNKALFGTTSIQVEDDYITNERCYKVVSHMASLLQNLLVIYKAIISRDYQVHWREKESQKPTKPKLPAIFHVSFNLSQWSLVLWLCFSGGSLERWGRKLESHLLAIPMH